METLLFGRQERIQSLKANISVTVENKATIEDIEMQVDAELSKYSC